MEYTKGDWYLVQDDTSTDTVIMTEDCTIGRVFSSGADAHLMVKAPKLYKALVIARGFLGCYEDKAHKEIAEITRQALAEVEEK